MMLSWAAHKPLEHTFAAMSSKKRLWAAKVVKILHGLPMNSMGFFNFFMGRTGKRKDAYFCGRYAANRIGTKR
jgi:hypothetical protein